ncbi:hypothetical protein AB8988_20680 [Yersinia enterocolitica]|uniref:hypothetical protein n=1 Tax=Yersinia enterocolitica TaxID=630 RepID=UPI003CFCCAF2
MTKLFTVSREVKPVGQCVPYQATLRALQPGFFHPDKAAVSPEAVSYATEGSSNCNGQLKPDTDLGTLL